MLSFINEYRYKSQHQKNSKILDILSKELSKKRREIDKKSLQCAYKIINESPATSSRFIGAYQATSVEVYF